MRCARKINKMSFSVLNEQNARQHILLVLTFRSPVYYSGSDTPRKWLVCVCVCWCVWINTFGTVLRCGYEDFVNCIRMVFRLAHASPSYEMIFIVCGVNCFHIQFHTTHTFNLTLSPPIGTGWVYDFTTNECNIYWKIFYCLIRTLVKSVWFYFDLLIDCHHFVNERPCSAPPFQMKFSFGEFLASFESHTHTLRTILRLTQPAHGHSFPKQKKKKQKTIFPFNSFVCSFVPPFLYES